MSGQVSLPTGVCSPDTWLPETFAGERLCLLNTSKQTR